MDICCHSTTLPLSRNCFHKHAPADFLCVTAEVRIESYHGDISTPGLLCAIYTPEVVVKTTGR